MDVLAGRTLSTPLTVSTVRAEPPIEPAGRDEQTA